MLLNSFLMRVQYDKTKPVDVSASRWAGMLKWFEARTNFQDGWSFPDEPRDEWFH